MILIEFFLSLYRFLFKYGPLPHTESGRDNYFFVNFNEFFEKHFFFSILMLLSIISSRHEILALESYVVSWAARPSMACLDYLYIFFLPISKISSSHCESLQKKIHLKWYLPNLTGFYFAFRMRKIAPSF